MLVRHDTRGDRLRFDSKWLQPLLDDAGTEAGVDHDTRLTALEQDGVAAAAASQHPHLHSTGSFTVQRRSNAACSMRMCVSVRSTCRRSITRRATSMNLSMRNTEYGGRSPHA